MILINLISKYILLKNCNPIYIFIQFDFKTTEILIKLRSLLYERYFRFDCCIKIEYL